jgi:hypothetical protein
MLRLRSRLDRVFGLATQEQFQRVGVDFGVAQRGLIDEQCRLIVVQDGIPKNLFCRLYPAAIRSPLAP